LCLSPLNFTESGSDFQYYGRYVWKVKEGVETTNMPPWSLVLTDNEIYRAVFYVQSFSTRKTTTRNGRRSTVILLLEISNSIKLQVVSQIWEQTLLQL
jgi:hypothetical protein